MADSPPTLSSYKQPLPLTLDVVSDQRFMIVAVFEPKSLTLDVTSEGAKPWLFDMWGQGVLDALPSRHLSLNG